MQLDIQAHLLLYNICGMVLGLYYIQFLEDYLILFDEGIINEEILLR